MGVFRVHYKKGGNKYIAFKYFTVLKPFFCSPGGDLTFLYSDGCFEGLKKYPLILKGINNFPK